MKLRETKGTRPSISIQLDPTPTTSQIQNNLSRIPTILSDLRTKLIYLNLCKTFLYSAQLGNKI